MSAIWGIVNLTAANEAGTDISNGFISMRQIYERKCKLDSIREYVSPNGMVMMACGIQHITKESVKEKLPLVYDDGKSVFTTDCILDNRDALIQELNRQRDVENITVDSPDGDITGALFNLKGADCLEMMRGIFSLANYNHNTQTLILATDPTASRCLYYHERDGIVYFSTLLEPLVKAAAITLENKAYLTDFLIAPGMMPNVTSDETPYAGVYKVEAGRYIRFNANDKRIVRYHNWSQMHNLDAYSSDLKNLIIKYKGKSANRSSESHAETIASSNTESLAENNVCSPIEKNREKSVGRLAAKKFGKEFVSLYRDCVSTTLRSTAKTGIAMSSGFDSASVGAFAADLLKERGESLMAYTYVPLKQMPSKPHFITNETDAVESIIRMHQNIDPHFLSRENKNAVEALDDVLETVEIPVKAYVNFPSLFEIYEHAAADSCKVVLTGQFGNSTVSHGLIDDVLLELYEQGKKSRFKSWLNRYAAYVGEDRQQALRSCEGYFEHSIDVKRNTAAKRDKVSKESDCNEVDAMEETLKRSDFVSDSIFEFAPTGYDIKDRLRSVGFESLESMPTDAEEYRRMLDFCTGMTYIGEYETKLGLKYGLVLRDPTRDVRMIEFCYNLPYELFAYRGTPRWFIREMLKDMLPESILSDWYRYGMQNADCYDRIYRDWEWVKAHLQRIVDDAEQNGEKRIDCDAIRAYIEGLDSSGEAQVLDWKFDECMFACAYARFCQMARE